MAADVSDVMISCYRYSMFITTASAFSVNSNSHRPSRSTQAYLSSLEQGRHRVSGSGSLGSLSVSSCPPYASGNCERRT